MATDEELGLVGLSDAPAQSGHLFGREDYREVLDRDFESCRRSLSIASSWCKLKQVNTLAARLSAVTARGVNVRVLLREPKRKTIEWERMLAVLRDACSEVCVAEEGSSRLDYVVCDEELVWYGKLPKYNRLTAELYSIRKAVFPDEMLGELHGWQGVRKENKKLYQEYGII